MDTGTTGEAEEAHKMGNSPLPDLEITSGSAETTSGRPRRATRLPLRHGKYRCHNTRLPANYISDNVRIGGSAPSLFAAVPDCIANKGA